MSGVPRPGLGTNRDEEAWCNQYRLLRYDLKMSGYQIAYIDWGGNEEAARWFGPIYDHYRPFVDVRAMIEQARRRHERD